jgi:hypothetical protein
MPERISPEDVILEVWELGNLGSRWAEAPLAITEAELDRYGELCDRANVDPARVLYRFQKYWSDKNKNIAQVPFGTKFEPSGLSADSLFDSNDEVQK